MKKEILITGAGPSGLVAAKSCLAEGCLSPVIFEKSSDLGGIWSGGSNGRAWEGMRSNISEWSMMFSDHPWGNNIQGFPTQAEYLAYLKSYAYTFNLLSRIRFNSEVTHLAQANHKWVVQSHNRTEKFDASIITSGFFSKENMPDITGQDIFGGRIIHAGHIQQLQMEPDQQVIVYGGSFSGYELAAKFAKAARKPVIHAFERPAWILNRYVTCDNGQKLPLDMVSYSRAYQETAMLQSASDKRQSTIDFFKASFGNPGAIHAALQVSETTDIPPYAVVSDDYLDLVRAKKIIPVCTNIDSFNHNALLLSNEKGGVDEYLADVVVMATGYQAQLPYLDDNIKSKIGYDETDLFMPVLLNQAVWPKDVDGLAFVGFYRGPFPAVQEMQARWIAAVWSGRLPPPSADELQAGMIEARMLRELSPRPQFPYPDYVSFADRLAHRVGCYPNLPPSDNLYEAVNKGPYLPSHLRLMGRYAKRSIVEPIIHSAPRME